MEISLPFPAHTLLKRIVVNRTKLRIVRLTFLVLLLCSAFVATATADDTKPDVAPAKPAEKEATQIKKEGAEPKTEAAVPETEDPKAKLLAMFKKQESITNTLGMVMVWVPSRIRCRPSVAASCPVTGGSGLIPACCMALIAAPAMVSLAT